MTYVCDFKKKKMMETQFLKTFVPKSTFIRFLSSKLIKKKIKGHSSNQWLLRQITDPYVEKAKFMNYRCRSAFKLLEIDDKQKILNPGDVVIDCGGAPGSWTQVAVQRTNSNGEKKSLAKGFVISVDLLPFQPIQGATILGGMDFTQSNTQEKIKNILTDRLVSCVLSDMAPNATGVKSLDQDKIIYLSYDVLKFSTLLLKKGGNLLVKVWDSGNVNNLEKEMLNFFEVVRRIKPKSSRQDSTELFLLGKTFKKL